MATVAHKRSSLGAGVSCALPATTSKSNPSNPWSFNTGLPYIGTIDFENPMEMVIWGGAAASILLAPGWWKLGIPVALIAIRYQMGKINT